MTIHEDIIAAYEKAVSPGVEVRITDCFYSFASYTQTDDFVELCSVEWDNEPWQFNITAVFHHKPTGALFYASDSGCSCPSPFESTTIADLEPLTRMQDWIDIVESSTRTLKLEEEDVRLGRLEDADYRSWENLSDLQRQLSSVTDQAHRVFNRISNHFDTHNIISDFTVTVVEEEQEDDDLI